MKSIAASFLLACVPVSAAERMNVLLSRAKQKLILATSQRFIREVVEGIDPDAKKDDLEFLRKMPKELALLTGATGGTTFGSGNTSPLTPRTTTGRSTALVTKVGSCGRAPAAWSRSGLSRSRSCPGRSVLCCRKGRDIHNCC